MNPKLEKNILKLLLLTAIILFVAGVIAPIMTITQLIFIKNGFSILSGLGDLFVKQQFLLFIIISLLSLVLPLIKILLLAWVLTGKEQGERLTKTINLIHNYGRWAMLDVLVVAILLVTVKLGAIASVKVHIGLYLFAGAVLITMWVTHRVVKILESESNLSIES